eukprot:TRINITY_DN1763_c0_g1_i4.p1 TRINITY_DN1763_c0_g1~~TRINITY_DN1763_c0_g1_i4.p1  ORF type:complete len:198 (-),score=27.98 TRINITY_DN1763_c0_g1_i4:1148-1741(-)
MKKILLLLAVVALSVTAFAQDVQFGLKGGLNFANLSGDDADGDVRTDIYLGGFARIGLTETLDFQPELIYSRQGSKDEEDNIDVKWKSSYLNIPLLLRANLFQSDNFHAIVGPQIGIHLDSEIEAEEGNYSQGTEINKMMNDLDLSLALGLEYTITDKIGIDLRYNLGISNIVDEDKVDGDVDIKNSVFQLGVSMTF